MTDSLPTVRRPTLDCSNDPGRTQQNFQNDADINVLVGRWLRGQEPPLPTRQALYGDFSTHTDYLSALTAVQQAELQFRALPARLRNRFDNDPAELLAFLDDPANRDKAAALGLTSNDEAVDPASIGENTTPDEPEPDSPQPE